MKHSFKKIVSLFTALVLCVSLSACGDSETVSEYWVEEEIIVSGSDTTQDGAGQTTSDTQSGNSQAASTTQSGNGNSSELTWAQIKAKMPSKLKNSTVTFWDWNEVSDRPGAADVIEKFTKETGIKVNFVRHSAVDDYNTKITAAVAANKSPDIVRLSTYNMGVINSLQPISDTGYDFSDKAWDSRVLNYYTFGKNTYAVNLKNTLYQQPYMLIYNKNLISKYDLEDPYTLWKQGKWTIQKFEEILEGFTEEAGDDYTAWTSLQFIDVAYWYGQTLVTRNGDTFVNNTTNQKLIKALQTYSNWREKGYITSVRFDRTNFENGKVLFFTESPIGLRKSHFYFSNLKKTGALAAVPNPTVDGGLDKNTTLIAEFEAYGFPKGAPNAQGAAYFLRYFLDADNYDKNTFFNDKTILDVYETLMKNPKIFRSADYGLITEDNGTRGEVIANRLADARANQVVTVLDQHSSIIDINIKQANSIAKKLGQ